MHAPTKHSSHHSHQRQAAFSVQPSAPSLPSTPVGRIRLSSPAAARRRQRLLSARTQNRPETAFLEGINANGRNRKPHRNPANPRTHNTERSREPATQLRGERAPESGTRRTTAAPPPQIKSQKESPRAPQQRRQRRTAAPEQTAKRPGSPASQEPGRASQPGQPRPAENRASFLEKISKQKQNFFRSRAHAKHH